MTQTVFELAVEAHKSGRLEEAEQGYRTVLTTEPENIDAWHLLGVVSQHRGHPELAVQYIERAIEIGGERPVFVVNLGVSLEAAGRLVEAVPVLEKVISFDPSSFLAHLTLGNVFLRLRRLPDATAHLEKALAIQPQNPSVHNNIGNVLKASGSFERAAHHYRQTILLQPNHHRAHYNLGVSLRELGAVDDAMASFQTAMAIVPQMPEALNELGVLHRRQKRLPEAIALLENAVEQKPNSAVFRNNLANTLIEAERFADAERHLQIAIAANPAFPESHYHLGNALKAREKFEEAVAAYKEALRLRPTFTKASVNLSSALYRLERYDVALKVLEAAREIEPASAELANAQGKVLQALKREDEALECYLEALRLDPELPDAHRNAGLALLMRGQFEAGWKSYEWRFRCEGASPHWRAFPYPEWQGETEKGTILVWGEQGLGDAILYASMVPDLLAQGHTVIMESKRRLIPLFERSFGVKAVMKNNPPDPATLNRDIRWHIPIGNLGGRLRPSLESFPQRRSYLKADETRRNTYRAILEREARGDMIVGISWRSMNTKLGPSKTLNLREWQSILKAPGVRFVDLQYGDTTEERAAAEAEMGVSLVHVPDLDLRVDVDGVAALATACDLIISVSNTTVHLASALGMPTWILVPASVGNIWYWMRDGERTPWYETARIFRQSSPGDWSDVLQTVQERLKAFIAERAGS